VFLHLSTPSLALDFLWLHTPGFFSGA
jgi:hypothetical protein